MKGIQVTAYGKPADVVKLVDVPDVGRPEFGEIVIDIDAASVEPSDLYVIAGSYGILPPLPHILGIQGVGRVSAVGSNVKHVKEGDRVIVPPFTPSWIERVKTTATWLRPLPTADLDQLAMLGINPATAYLLLTRFVQLKRGDWLLQNAANSSIGRAVIALAKLRGLRTVNVVRRAELVDEIKAIGGDIALVDGEDLPKRVAEATGKASIQLALDGVANSATQRLLNSIASYGTVVVWSAMSGRPFTVSGPPVIFRDQTIRGMWIFNWFQTLKPEQITEMYAELVPLIASGALSFPVAGRFSFDQYLGALDVASKYSGKAILTPDR
ncbi:MAG: zinc-dependent alcohol dehydrogenase family protein [Xanthobacteraceae bacterium]|nr:zinc-dependent alcohol dehydrogenase family protein [Xanthobacteraceae bacterium]MBV9632813.1 zinc-dependent alcohol dehydrogenase family protein [Xanthobacteraceae bacterium]